MAEWNDREVLKKYTLERTDIFDPELDLLYETVWRDPKLIAYSFKRIHPKVIEYFEKRNNNFCLDGIVIQLAQKIHFVYSCSYLIDIDDNGLWFKDSDGDSNNEAPYRKYFIPHTQVVSLMLNRKTGTKTGEK